MKILVIDGQGGKMGKILVESLRTALPGAQLIAVGTNAMATLTMLKAGAHAGATGENPVVVNARDADIIVGPVGIVVADSLLGEVTAPMALAVSQSPALRVLIPVNKCNTLVAGAQDITAGEAINKAVELIVQRAANMD